MLKKLDHVVITTKDPEACLNFYQKLGFTASYDGGRYELFAGDFKINVHIKGSELLPHAQNVQPGSGDFCFEISDNTNLEQLKSSLIHQGLIIELGVVNRHGVNGEMSSIYLRDPDGNLVELCSYK